jgi:hypothetical protein
MKERLDENRGSMRERRAAQHAAGSGAEATTPTSARNSIWSVIMPADGTRAASAGNGDFGRSPIFGQLSGEPLLAYK